MRGQSEIPESIAMPEVYPLPYLAEREFSALRELMRSQKDFPTTFDAWNEHWARRRRQEEQDHGHQVLWIEFQVPDFVAFCNRAQMVPSLAALAAFIHEASC
jgi:hypothetical protein